MRKLWIIAAVILFFAAPLCAEDGFKIVLLIREQNIEGPQKAWWASEIDLSATEAALASELIKQGHTILEPQDIKEQLEQKPAYRKIDLPAKSSIEMGRLLKADYVLLGKAVASSGGNVPQSNMRSCFANITARLIRVSDGSIIAYLEASGSSVHPDPITGGKEALINAAHDLAVKLSGKLELPAKVQKDGVK